MKNLIRIVVLLALASAGRDLYRRSFAGAGSGHAPPLSYVDTQGGSRSLSAPTKPTVLVLWVTPCPYCHRALKVLDSLRGAYSLDDLDVVGLYLNRADDASVDRIAGQDGHLITMAQGQPTGEFVQSLTQGLAFRAPGRDIYVIGKDGRYQAVDASDLRTPDDKILGEVRAILRNKHGLQDRSG
jgi:glutaredoxin